MLSLSHQQLQIVMDAARAVPQEKRAIFLERIAAMLTVRGRGHFNNDDVADVVSLASVGLTQHPAV